MGALLLALSACAAEPEPASPHPRFDPLTFFAGRTHGDGVIDPIVGSDRRLRVDSIGYRDRGGILLNQRIVEGEKPARIRRWRLGPAAPSGSYSGWLTDAEGRVSARAQGNRMTIRYETPDGSNVEQHLTLQPDRRTVANLMIVRKLGLPVATVRETIRKLD